MKEILVEKEVVDYIKEKGRDFRVSTSCYGAVILPTDMKPPKSSDLQIDIEDNTLYVSRVQAQFIDHLTSNMIFENAYLDGCEVFRE